MASKCAWECRACRFIYDFRGKSETNNRVYYSWDQYGNPDVLTHSPTSDRLTLSGIEESLDLVRKIKSRKRNFSLNLEKCIGAQLRK